MSTQLFSSTLDFRSAVGGGANISIDLTNLAPTMQLTAQKYIIPYLGTALYNTLLTAVTEDEVDNLSIPNKELLPFVKRALGYLTLAEYSRISGVMLTDNGLQRFESDTHKTAYARQELDYRKAMLEGGWDHLEQMIILLESDATAYENWHTNVMPDIRRDFIYLASQLRLYYAGYVNRHTFEVLRPIFQEIDQHAIEPLLGSTFYAALKTKWRSKANLSAAEQAVVNAIVPACAKFAISEAQRRLWVRNEGTDIVMTDSGERTDPRQASTAAAVGEKIRHLREFAERQLSYARKVLNDHIDDLPTYKDFITAKAAADQAKTPSYLGEDSRYYHGCRCGYYSCTGSCSNRRSEDNKGIVKL